MRITHIETHAVRIPLVPAKHMITALGKHTESPYLMVRVGTDVARVRAVRSAIGPKFGLTIDANCGWDVDTAIRCLHELEDCQIALDEQPTPDGDYAAIARVRRETKPPVMADDMCFDLVHA